jgi:hypothetical protein
MARFERLGAGALTALAVTATLAGQQAVPRPFPQPSPPPSAPAPPAAPASPPSSTRPAPTSEITPSFVPTEAMLGVPIFTGAQFLTSYFAGRGQRYFLFGTTSPFLEVVAFYRTALKQRGSLIFDAPATHMFDVGRFREDSMAFPPGVTVKDYTWGGSAGYLNPRPGVQPARFPTIVQIVPVPPTPQR